MTKLENLKIIYNLFNKSIKHFDLFKNTHNTNV